MEGYGPSTHGDRIAGTYDETHAALFDAEHVTPSVDLLAELALGGRALELGIDTGRIALPLAAKGVPIQGIDASEAMVAMLRAKEGGGDIPMSIGDFAEFVLDTEFSLIFVVFNTFFALLTQDAQVRCIQSAGDHIGEDGVFVIEAFVPDLSRFARGQYVEATAVETDEARQDITRHDPVSQLATTQHVYLTEGGIKMYPVQVRYAWPSELDLMARLAGLRLRDRWSDWRRSPFTNTSTGHISVYEKE
jgi:SAM-dependent methyltransferase